MGKALLDFGQEGLLAMWQNMGVDERNQLVKNLDEFHGLLSSLKGRGLARADNQLREIVLNERTPETERLIELRDLAGANTIKITWLEKTVTPSRKPRKRKTPA